jgi:hypothetical protein
LREMPICCVAFAFAASVTMNSGMYAP